MQRDMQPKKKKKISNDEVQPVIEEVSEEKFETPEPSVQDTTKIALLNDVIDTSVSWESLGLAPALLKTLIKLKYKNPTKIQRDSIPYALQARDIIGIAQTGSGKTASYVLPILHQLLSARPSPASTLVLSPTRELSLQIKEHFDALGADIGLKTILLVGGVGSKNEQKIQIQQEKPHIVIATPGRLVDHLVGTTGFNLRNVKYLVLDEADKLLGTEYEKDMGSIFSQINTKERKTYLYSATMTKNVEKLLKVQMKDPVKVQITTSKYATVDSIKQEYLFVPEKFKEVYLVYLLNENPGKRVIVFGGQSATVLALSIMTRSLGFPAVPLSGQMDDKDRTHCLRKFKTGDRPILIATDIAARGLDLPLVDLVINFDIPTVPKEYVHRIGRTGRIGKDGRAITIVTQYDVEYFQKIEKLIEKKLDLCPSNKDQVMTLVNTVTSATEMAKKKIRDKDIRVSDDRGDEEEVIDTAIKILSQKRDDKRKENKKFKNKRDRSNGKSQNASQHHDDQDE